MRKLLYSNGSPYARRVRVVLKEKGMEFESDVNDNLRPIEEIQPHNPALQVPVFYDGDRQLFGSNLIVHYLFAEYAELPSQPADPPLAPSITRPDRHWDDMLTLTAIESAVDALINVRLLQSGGKLESPYIDRQFYRIGSCLDWLEHRVTPEGFWPGVFSVMDMNLMFPLIYGERRGTFDFRSGRWTGIAAMIDHWAQRPSVLATPINDLPPRGGVER